MPILEMKDKDGKVVSSAIVCGRGLKSCHWCGRLQTKLCDFPLSDKKTCDASMCDEHATHAGKDLDYCPMHKDAAKQKGLW
jgi:hypothetical protein